MTSQKVYVTPGTPVVFKDTDGTYTITLNNLANGVGRISKQWDRGAGSQPDLYRVRCSFAFEATHTIVVGERINVFLATSDGTNVDGTVGTSDAALTANQALNLRQIGVVVVDVVSKDAKITATFDCLICERYVSVGVLNNTSDHMQADNDANTITLTPYPSDIQAAA
jgi:hypothetical protein